MNCRSWKELTNRRVSKLLVMNNGRFDIRCADRLAVWSFAFAVIGSLVGFSSSCIPHADRLQATLAGLTPKITADEAVNRIKTQPLTVTDASQQTVTLPANATAEARELVVFAQPSKDPPSGLEIRLAWEIDITNAPIKKVYLDAISERDNCNILIACTIDCLNLTREQQNSILGLNYQEGIFGVSLCTISILRTMFHGN